MVLPIFSTKINYYKNGIFWWQKLINRTIGESMYDRIRMEKRIASSKFYYTRQNLLYTTYIDFPDIAQTIGLFSKVDTSHGFPQVFPFEPWKDPQENSLNGDGFFAMFVYYVCAAYTFWTIYIYLLPWYWSGRDARNGNEEICRMRDAYATAIYEEIIGNMVAEYAFSPHLFESYRDHVMSIASKPDDIRYVHFTSINRKNNFKDPYMEEAGYSGSMDSA